MRNKLNVVPYDAGLQKLASCFTSGNDYLDRFLRSADAIQNSFGRTYVLLTDDDSMIVGYYNIGVGYIEQIFDGVRRKLGGSAHINCFALDERYHGILQAMTPEGVKVNLSDVLLDDCIKRIYEIREEIGFTFITLCSTKQGYSLYKRNDFEDLETDMNFSTEEETRFNTEEDGDFCAPMYMALDYE